MTLAQVGGALFEFAGDSDDAFPVGPHLTMTTRLRAVSAAAAAAAAASSGGATVTPASSRQTGYLSVWSPLEHSWTRTWCELDGNAIHQWPTRTAATGGKAGEIHGAPQASLPLAGRGALAAARVPRSDCLRANTFAVTTTEGALVCRMAADSIVSFDCSSWSVFWLRS